MSEQEYGVSVAVSLALLHLAKRNGHGVELVLVEAGQTPEARAASALGL